MQAVRVGGREGGGGRGARGGAVAGAAAAEGHFGGVGGEGFAEGDVWGGKGGGGGHVGCGWGGGGEVVVVVEVWWTSSVGAVGDVFEDEGVAHECVVVVCVEGWNVMSGMWVGGLEGWIGGQKGG